MNSIQRIQQLLGVTPDGDFGPISNQALQDAIGDADIIEPIQAILGVTQDDDWGPISNAALQALLRPPPPPPAYILIADGNHNDPWPPPAGMLAFIHKVSEGTWFQDPLCARRMTAFARKRGFYHFTSGEEPRAQAANFLAALGQIGYRAADLICLDFEESSRSGDSDMTAAGAAVWITTVEAALGCKVCVYGSDLLMAALAGGAFAGRPLWPAWYDATPPTLPGGRQWAIWQFTENGAPYSDMNKITAAALSTWPALPV
jgi:hypothetical protein